jgi:uroporphyrinogen decarboxylase
MDNDPFLDDSFDADIMGFDELTPWERVNLAVSGEEVDRLPVCFWHHFKPEGSGRKLAEATYAFFIHEFDLDIAKIMPDIPYPFPHNSIRSIDDWRLIEPIDESSRYFQQRIEAVRLLREMAGPSIPIVMTYFSPLAELMYFAGNKRLVAEHAQQHPAIIHQALHTVAMNLKRQIDMVIDAGADGTFFAAQGCTRSLMTEEVYREIGRPYDLIALEGAADAWLNILHVHGDKDLMFDAVLDYPVSVLSWSDRLAGPSLREARTKTSKCLMGGWHEFGPLSNGPEAAILTEAEEAVAQTNGRKFILANGCSVPDDTDHEWLHMARDLVETIQFPS